MFKYLFLCFNLLAPVKISTMRSFKTLHSYNSQIVCMVFPFGDVAPKGIKNSYPSKEGCDMTSEIIHHNDGNTTEIISVSFTKKIKRDKDGNVIKETDTSQPMYQSAKKSFFSSLSGKKK